MSEAVDVGTITGGSSVDVAGIFDAIDGAIDGWYAREGSRRQSYADDPCRYVVDLDHVRGDLQGKLRTLVAAEAVLDAGIQDAVARALADNGEGNVSGVDPFAEYLVDRRVVPAGPALGLAAALGGPIAAAAVQAAWVDYVRAWLPWGSSPSSSNTGYRLAAGVYLRGSGPLQTRQLQGSQVRAAWLAWRELVRQDAAPGGKPWARSRLAGVRARIPLAEAALGLHDVRRAEAVSDCAIQRAQDWRMQQDQSGRLDVLVDTGRIAALSKAAIPFLILIAVLKRS